MSVNPSNVSDRTALTAYEQYEHEIGVIFNRTTRQRLADFFAPGHFLPHFNTNYFPQLALYEETGKLPDEIKAAMLANVPTMKLPDLFSQI